MNLTTSLCTRVAIIAFLLPSTCFSWVSSAKLSLPRLSVTQMYSMIDYADTPLEDAPSNGQSRRDMLSLGGKILASSGILSLFGAGGAMAAEKAQNEAGMVEASTLASRLHSVPTFAIVDEKGVPYTVVGEDAKVTGYFFTTFGEASRILKFARQSSDKGRKEALSYLRLRRRQENLPPLSSKEEEDEVGTNPWVNARISTVPLDFAATLVIKSETNAGKGKVYFKVAPAEEDIADALALDKSGKDDLPEGRVPLFYFEDFEKESNGEKQSPLYFRKSELIEDWKKLNPSKDVPKVMVSELFTVMTEMVKPGGTDEDLKTLVFVSPKESAQKAKECLKAGGKEAAFKVGETNIVL